MNPKRPNSYNSKIPFWKRDQIKKNHSADKVKAAAIDFVLSSNTEVGISIPYALYDGKKKQIIKNSGGMWDDGNKLWIVQKEVVKELSEGFKNQYPEITINEIPDITYRALIPMGESIEIKNEKGKKISSIDYEKWDFNYKPEILLPFHDKLFPFQQVSVKFGIEHHGRLLLGDQMGVGKTIQALALAYIYKQEWPLLIICPSSLKYNWQDEILRWYKDIRKFEIEVVRKKMDENKKQKSKIIIISYQMCRKYVDFFSKFQTVIVDEAHYLKTLDSKRSEALVPFLKSRKRVFLLTGTPALAKPRELFNLLSIIRPDIYYNFKEFGNRYCDPQRSPWSNLIEYNGCKFPNELYFMIKDRIMIRRLKKEVLTQLPPKIRQKITLECDSKYTKEIATLMANNPSFADFSTNFDNQTTGQFILGTGQANAFTNAYSTTALAKIDGVQSYLKQLIENDVKMIVFAHHRVMMDAIQSLLQKQKVNFIRIDGNTTPEKRNENVKQFQQKAIVRCALLSITAAGVGLTLTASSTVIFAQLHWTPAVMFQAEDRAHRIGQPSCVNCHYLVGECTIDDYIYMNLQRKFNSVSQMVDGEKNKINAQKLEKGAIGDISKAAQAIRKLEESGNKKRLMSRLQDYWKSKTEDPQNGSKISEVESTQKVLTQQKHDLKLLEDLEDSESLSLTSEEELKILLDKRNKDEKLSKRVSENLRMGENTDRIGYN